MSAKAKALGKKIKNAVVSAVATPLTFNSDRRKTRFDRDAKTLKDARAYDNAPNFDDKGATPAYKARFMAEVVRNKYKGGVK